MVILTSRAAGFSMHSLIAGNPGSYQGPGFSRAVKMLKTYRLQPLVFFFFLKYAEQYGYSSALFAKPAFTGFSSIYFLCAR
jgi:hypothetical protein